jgi:hypothetical protein
MEIKQLAVTLFMTLMNYLHTQHWFNMLNMGKETEQEIVP